MAKTLKEKNQMECNKKARAKYIANNYSFITVRFKNSEIEKIEDFCKQQGITKSALAKIAIVEYVKNNTNNN